MIALPARLIVRTYLARSARLWVAARGLLVLQLLLADQDPFGIGVSLTAVVLTTLLGLVEIEWRRERALIGNLGLGMRDLLPLWIVAPVMGEVTIEIVRRVVTSGS